MGTKRPGYAQDARIDIRRGDSQRRLQFLERFYRCKTRKIFFHALVGGQPEPGGRPAPEIREARACSDLGHFFQRCSRAVSHGDQCAYARTGYAIDGNSRVAQNAKDTDVCNTAREAARKGQTDAWALCGFALLAVREGSKLVLRRSKPAAGAGDFAFFRHFSILVLSPRISLSFDPRMPVL